MDIGGNLDLKVFTDADWVGNIDDKKSTSGGAFFLGKRLVSLTSKKKNCTSQSIAEAEYVATIVNYSNIVWFKQLLEGMTCSVITQVQSIFQRIQICIPKPRTFG